MDPVDKLQSISRIIREANRAKQDAADARLIDNLVPDDYERYIESEAYRKIVIAIER